jgi:hypothetical protein
MTVLEYRYALVASIHARDPLVEQLAKADAYIAAIKAHGKLLGQRLPVPNRYAILRQLA